MSDKPAILGGAPVRNKPYPEHSTMIGVEEEQAVIEVLRGEHLSGFSARPGDRFLGGVKVREMEQSFAAYFDTRFAVSFNSATSGLHAAVAAAGVGPGDEVITSPYTMSATASAIAMTNGIPVFADIEERTFGLDPTSVRQRLTKHTKAILTVNIFGHPSQLDELKAIADEHGLMLIEDNAQSPGMRFHGEYCGTVGSMGVLSLNYHKGIQTGEGGVVLTDDEDLAERLQLIRNHGEVVVGKIDYPAIENTLGWNYRLTEIQAAIGTEQIKKLDKLNGLRSNLAAVLTKKLEKFDFLRTPIVEQDCTHGYYLYPLKFDQTAAGINRDTFVRAMQAEGVSLGAGYVKPIYLEPMYQRQIAYGKMHCPFKCPLYTGDVSYEQGLCPTAERMHFSDLMTTDICKYPNTETEVEEFVVAVEKIADHISELQNI